MEEGYCVIEEDEVKEIRGGTGK
uniref:Uncharacterized protein n=1 Tax=Anguilla anguilla TaxID=7936 RepID=A0A0E9TW37_ANGAN